MDVGWLPRAKQDARGESDGVFVDEGEDEGGDQSVENPAEHAAEGDVEEELGEPRGAGPIVREAAVAHERRHEEGGDVKDEDRDVLEAATEALREIKGRRAVPALIDALKDKVQYVRWVAAEALGEIKDRRAVPALTQALKDKDEYVRQAAAEALKMSRPTKREPL
jgi:hypothetical protein